MTQLIISCIGIYRRISRALIGVGFPLTAWSGCRQWPTCSDYTISAVNEYGVGGGLYRAFRRILNCHPFHFSH